MKRSSILIGNVMRPRGRTVAKLALALALVSGTGIAQATWSAQGGDAGRSGFEFLDGGGVPLVPVYDHTAASERDVRSGPLVTAGVPSVQRLVYGTAGGSTRSVHVQKLTDGTPVGAETGVDVNDGLLDADTFTGVGGGGDGSVGFVESSSVDGLGQVFVVHNDDDQAGVDDIALAQIDESTGTLVGDLAIAGTDGYTISSSALLTPPDGAGDRVLLFVAADGVGSRLFRIAITNPQSTTATIGTATSRAIGTANPKASPTLAYLKDDGGTATPYVAIAADDGIDTRLRTYAVSDLSVTGPTSPALGGIASTPATPLTADGLTPGTPGSGELTTPDLFVAVDVGGATEVRRLSQSGHGQTLAMSTSGSLSGSPSHGLVVAATSSGGTPGGAKVVVSTQHNLYVLSSNSLNVSATYSGTNLVNGTTGFGRTAPTVTGSLILIAQDDGRQLVLRKTDAQPVAAGEFTPSAANAGSTRAHGAPAVDRGYVVFTSDRGVFVHRTTDTTPPTSKLAAPADGAKVSRTVALSARASDERGIQDVTFKLDGIPVGVAAVPVSGTPYAAPGADYSITFDTTTRPDGTYALVAESRDPAANVTSSSSRAIVIDNTAPQTRIESGPSGVTGANTPSFGFAADEAGSSFECRVDGAPYGPCTSPSRTALLADGAHVIDVRATDAAGNVDATPASRSFTVDTRLPETTIDVGPSGLTDDSTPSFEFSANTQGAAFACRVDGGDWGPCVSPFTAGHLSEGAHTFEVRSTNALGFVDDTPAGRSLVVDTVAPETTLEPAPAGTTSDNTPTFRFRADSPGSRFECSLDGHPFVPCASPQTTRPLADGAHSFAVRAIDPADNVDGTPATRSLTIDADGPARVAVTDRLIPVSSHGVGSVRVSCASSRGCASTITLRTAASLPKRSAESAGSRGVAARRGRSMRVIGTARVKTKTKGSTTVRMRLNAAGRRLVAARGRVTAQATVATGKKHRMYRIVLKRAAKRTARRAALVKRAR